MTLAARDMPQENARRVSAKVSVDKKLLSRLSALRREIAEAQHVPPFIIFTNATLRDMANKRPKNRREMLRVDGVGENKMERYGSAFIREIEAYEEAEAYGS